MERTFSASAVRFKLRLFILQCSDDIIELFWVMEFLECVRLCLVRVCVDGFIFVCLCVSMATSQSSFQ